MNGPVPPRPAGKNARARFMQWVWDTIMEKNRLQAVAGTKTSTTTQGFVVIPKEAKEPQEELQPGGGPVTDALWHPERNLVYAVRGGRLMELDLEGKLLRTLTYCDPAMGDDYMVLQDNGSLWISHWYDPSAMFDDQYPPHERECNKGFYVVDPGLMNDPALFFFTEPFEAFSFVQAKVTGTPPVPNLASIVRGNAADLGDDDTERELDTTDEGNRCSIDLYDLWPISAPDLAGAGDSYVGDVLTIGPFVEDTLMTGGPFRLYGGIKINGVFQSAFVAHFHDYGSFYIWIKAGDTVTFELTPGFDFTGFQSAEEFADGYAESHVEPPFVQNTKLRFCKFEQDYSNSLIEKSNFAVGPRRVLTDDDGLMWATFYNFNDSQSEFGVAVFDGGGEITASSLVAFANNIRNSVSNFVGPCALNCLAKDGSGQIWISIGTGIARATIDGDDILIDQKVEITDNSEPELGAYGITYYDGRIWIATRTPVVYAVDTSDLSVESFDIGFDFATPRNIRAAHGFLWIPTMSDDRVIQLNPDGTVEDVHTGFDQPWDIFATDSVVWAMQLGAIAIKRVAQFD